MKETVKQFGKDKEGNRILKQNIKMQQSKNVRDLSSKNKRYLVRKEEIYASS